MQDELKQKTPISRLMIIIAAAILLLILGIVIGYYMSQGNVSNQVNSEGTGNTQVNFDPSSISNIANTAQPQTQTESIDETANWKTYTNNKYTYYIKYPTDWYLYDSITDNVRIQPEKDNPEEVPGPSANALSIKVSNTNSELTLEQEISKDFNKSGSEWQEISEVTIGGIDGLMVRSVCDGVGCGNTHWFVINRNMLYHFDSNLGYTVVFQQIINSFKFAK